MHEQEGGGTAARCPREPQSRRRERPADAERAILSAHVAIREGRRPRTSPVHAHGGSGGLPSYRQRRPK